MPSHYEFVQLTFFKNPFYKSTMSHGRAESGKLDLLSFGYRMKNGVIKILLLIETIRKVMKSSFRAGSGKGFGRGGERGGSDQRETQTQSKA